MKKPPTKGQQSGAVFKKPAPTSTPRRLHTLPPVVRGATPELNDAKKARKTQEEEIHADELAIQQLEAEIAKLEAAQAQERLKAKDQDSMMYVYAVCISCSTLADETKCAPTRR